MNLDEFKVATEEQLKAYGDTIPLGYTYDSNGNELTYKDSDGYWCERTYDTNNNRLTFKSSTGYWCERTYNTNGKVLTYKNFSGYWGEYTYDSNNNLLTFKDSDGYRCEHTYDTNNNVLTYKDSDGANQIALHNSTRYTLYYDIDSHKYVAGCQTLTYKECLAYYKLNKDKHEDAELFMKIIKEHRLGK